MGFASLGSGSRGNGTVIALAGRLFLVDCGFTLKQTEARLQRLGLAGGDLDGIFVTHEHADHINGVRAPAHKYAIPVYGSWGTLKKGLEGVVTHTFDGDDEFEVEGVNVTSVRVPHDAKEPTQYIFGADGVRVGVLSDLGCVTHHVMNQFSQCTHLLLEANHDRQMLQRGSYPPRLKRRVGEDLGHLSNEQAWSLLKQIAHPEMQVVIGHISEQNNHLDILQRLFEPLRGGLSGLDYATQQEGFAWIGYKPIQRQASLGAL